ncbi:MAG: trehalose-phosphatase, partial [Gemmatimonadales bacterium]
MSDLARILSSASDWLAGEGSILLMTDYDGTLTPIVDDPADALLSEEVREQLVRIARSPRGCVALISGRALE